MSRMPTARVPLGAMSSTTEAIEILADTASSAQAAPAPARASTRIPRASVVSPAKSAAESGAHSASESAAKGAAKRTAGLAKKDKTAALLAGLDPDRPMEGWEANGVPFQKHAAHGKAAAGGRSFADDGVRQLEEAREWCRRSGRSMEAACRLPPKPGSRGRMWPDITKDRLRVQQHKRAAMADGRRLLDSAAELKLVGLCVEALLQSGSPGCKACAGRKVAHTVSNARKKEGLACVAGSVCAVAA